MIAGLVAYVADIPPGWASIVLGVLGLIGTVAAILLAGSARSHSKATRNQVENDHDANLRDDLDGKNDVTRSLINGLGRKIDSVSREQKRQGEDLGMIKSAVARHSDQIWDLEKTQPRSSTPRKRR